MSKPEVVVLGAGYAGMSLALRLARKTEAHITLVNAGPDFVERVRLHQRAAGQEVGLHPIVNLIAGTDITFEQGYVTALDPQNRTVTVNKGGSEKILAYDNLVYTLGSTIDRDSVEGVREYADVVTLEKLGALHEKLAGLRRGARLVICGGGLTGIESSTELAEAYPELDITLVTRGKFPQNLSEVGARYIRRTFAKMGITVRDETEILRLTAKEVVTGRGNLPYDVVIWAGAFVPSPLAREAGIKTNAQGQILVDTNLRSLSHPEIYAAGDAAAIAEFSPHLRMACATALPMAAHLADNLAAQLKGRPLKDYRFRYYIRCISLGRHNGMLQVVGADDTPRELVFTGALGAFLKEQVVRFAYGQVNKERPSARSKSAEPAIFRPVS